MNKRKGDLQCVAITKKEAKRKCENEQKQEINLCLFRVFFQSKRLLKNKKFFSSCFIRISVFISI